MANMENTENTELNDILSEIVLERFPNMHIGYKKCQDNRIVVLEIVGENNEDRKDIFDKSFAKMRCAEAKVLTIVDMHDPNKTFESATGIYDISFVYRVNEIVKPTSDYCEQKDKVCRSGIHYFLSIKPVLQWKLVHKNGLYESWHENGNNDMRCTFKDGKIYGLFESWYESNGRIKERYMCKDGKKDGLCETWYENGNNDMRCTFKDGKKDGLCETWYENGNNNARCTFKDEKVDGLCESWHENGMKWRRCTFKDGKLDGLFESWYENGNNNVRCTFKDENLDGLAETWYENGNNNVRHTFSNTKI